MGSNQNMCGKSNIKRKLAQKGLVSCLDYYIERHALKLKRTAVYGTVRTVV